MWSRTLTEPGARPAPRRLAAALLVALPCGVAASERLEICFDYGCRTRQAIEVTNDDVATLRPLFDGHLAPAAERDAIARAVGMLYRVAGRQSEIWRDRGGNLDDDDTKNGRMDCIDHSTNTTTFVAFLARRGWLVHHGPGERDERGFFLSLHWTATVTERATGARWAVDSWFFDPGTPAEVYPLAEWRAGRRPPNTGLVRFGAWGSPAR
jgi:hypothetical protein